MAGGLEMAEKILGTMRCPAGAVVAWDEQAKSHVVRPDGWASEEEKGRSLGLGAGDKKAGERHLSKLLKGRARCGETGQVSEHATDRSLLVCLCPKHGPVEARADIWKQEVRT